ncbi:MAG: PilZ domain-containing protein [Proteobacteria bacterium]|nr:PilZ domain-containing protein [Pseudomonadota bacterium]
MPPGQEQRRHPRYPLTERAAILMGPATFVFSETVDISHGGACLRQPNRFVVHPGEQLNLASPHMGSHRIARVVHISPRGVHCAFDDPIAPTDSATSAAL